MSNNLNLKLTMTRHSTQLEIKDVKAKELREVLKAVTDTIDLSFSEDDDIFCVTTDEIGGLDMVLDDSADEYVEVENSNYDKYLAKLEEASILKEAYSAITVDQPNEDYYETTSLVACNCVGCGVTIIKRLPNEGDQIVHCNRCGEDTEINSTVRGKIKCPSCGFETRLSRVEASDNEDILLKCGKCKTEVVGRYHETNHMYVLNN